MSSLFSPEGCGGRAQRAWRQVPSQAQLRARSQPRCRCQAGTQGGSRVSLGEGLGGGGWHGSGLGGGCRRPLAWPAGAQSEERVSVGEKVMEYCSGLIGVDGKVCRSRLVYWSRERRTSGPWEAWAFEEELGWSGSWQPLRRGSTCRRTRQPVGVKIEGCDEWRDKRILALKR